MKKIILKLNNSSHPIFIGKNIFSHNIFQNFMIGRKVLIISHEKFFHHYLDKINFSLNFFQKFYLFIEEGEKNKSLTNLEKIIKFLIKENFDKSDTIIGFGGGVVGDLAGLAASIYMRGIAYIQIPTSLLAQGNSCVGGKTGINYRSLKNILGTIWYPRCVLIDIETLSTLKKRDFLSGIPEITLQALIRDKVFFEYLETTIELLKKRNPNILIKVLFKSCSIKARVVEEAEKDPKIRNILNYGHTLAHAIEALYACNEILHGEAVGYGICFASFLSYKLGFLNERDYFRIKNFIDNLGIETPTINVKDVKKLVLLMNKDKKTIKNHIHFVLLNAIGQTLIWESNDSFYLESILLEFIKFNKKQD